MTQQLGQLLVEQAVISSEQLEIALSEQAYLGSKLGVILCKLGMATEDDIARAVARQAGIEYIAIKDLVPDASVLTLVPESVAKKHNLMPVRVDGERLVVAMENPADIVALDEVQRVTHLPVSVAAAAETALIRVRNRAYRALAQSRSAESLTEEAIDAVVQRAVRAVVGDGAREEGVIELVQYLIDMALRFEATDIHLEPDENLVRVRLRIDGSLVLGPPLPRELSGSIVTRVKVMADLNIAETRIPQDGKIRYRSGLEEVDLRISTFPSIFGESIVIRILGLSSSALKLDKLGLNQDQVQLLGRLAKRPNGLILVTGPTGSGKTTSLYALLRTLDAPSRKIITLEDPVEYRLPMTTQCQINERAGVSFATGLRSILRHDPDVILIGEMRDRETASIAVRAALTGHLVLSTLHTNDAVSTLARLRELEVEPYLIASCLLVVVAQRLVRRLCPQCRSEHTPSAHEPVSLGITTGRVWWRSTGCPSCSFRGLSGRTGLFEILEMTAAMKPLLLSSASDVELLECASQSGFVPLRDGAIERARSGEISLEEVARLTAEN